MLEIENHSNTQFRDPQIVQHQTAFVVGDSVDHFRVHDYGIKRNDIGNKQPDLSSFVEHIERRLVEKGWLLAQTRPPKRFRKAFRLARGRGH